MATQSGIRGRWAVGRGLTRPALAYLVVFAVGVWVYSAIRDITQGSGLVRAVVAATTVFRDNIVLLPVCALLLLPAMVLTIELVHRFEADTIAARTLIGAASWVGWGVFGAIALVVASRVVLVAETLVGYLLVLSIGGAVFSLLAFDGYDTRPGKVLTALAVVGAIMVVVGSIWMAGRWGGPA